MKTNRIVRWGYRVVGCVTLAAMSLSVTSCEGFLDEELYNKYSTDNYFQDVEYLDMAVLALYRAFQARGTYGQAMLAYDNDTDISHINGSAVNSGNEWRDIAHYYPALDISWLEVTWRTFWEGINNANVILANVEKVPTATTAEAERLVRQTAETKFLRGMMYFDLVRLFGDVPVKLTASEYGQDFMLPRVPKEEVYAQIVKDMEEAIPNLPWHDDSAHTKDTRVSKGAAMGMLARVYLYRAGYSLYQDGTMKKPENSKAYYQKVVDITEEIIQSGKHGLNESYEQIFRNHCDFVLEPRESMFEIDFFYNPGKSDLQGYIGSWNALVTADGLYSRANAFVRTHSMYYGMFEATDLRRDVAIGTYQVLANGNQQQYPIRNSQNWGLGKWRREWQSDITTQKLDMNLTNINYVVLRYSDILLMRAEAINEVNSGPTGEARELVNQVRRRGYGQSPAVADPAIDMKANEGTDYQSFLAYLQDERARELGFEAMTRKMDLIRWNLLATKIKETYDICKANYELANDVKIITLEFTAGEQYVHGRNELYKIPPREIRENPNLVQNPGYGQ